jgi:hypothetical protein
MPAWMPMPAKANTPLIGMEPPMTISLSAARAAGNGRRWRQRIAVASRLLSTVLLMLVSFS